MKNDGYIKVISIIPSVITERKLRFMVPKIYNNKNNLFNENNKTFLRVIYLRNNEIYIYIYLRTRRDYI